MSLRSPKHRQHHQENVSHTPRRSDGAVMSRYAMRIAIQRRDNILIIIGMNAFVWFLRSNITLENVTTSQFYIALGAANLVLLCMYVARYCRLSAAFAALPSKLAEAPYFAFPRSPAAAAADSGGSDEGERDYIDEESRGEDEENYREEDDEEDSVGEDSGIEPLESLGGVAASGGGSGARRIVARDSDGNVVLGDTIKKLEDKVCFGEEVEIGVGSSFCFLFFPVFLLQKRLTYCASYTQISFHLIYPLISPTRTPLDDVGVGLFCV